MDIKRLPVDAAKENEGVPVLLVKRDEEPDIASDGTRSSFTMLGRDSKKVSAVMDRQQREYAKMRGSVTPERVMANRIEVAVAACIAWAGIEDGEGADAKPFPLTPDNAMLVFSDRHYLEQAERGIFQHASFFTKASAS